APQVFPRAAGTTMHKFDLWVPHQANFRIIDAAARRIGLPLFAVDIFIRQAQEVTAAAGISLDEIDLWVPHQANFRIIDAAARRIGLPLDKVAINIDQFGNTSSASIPLALEDAVRNGRVHSGDHVLLAGFGSGLTWGATLLKWA